MSDSEKLTPLDFAVAFALETQARHSGYAWPGTEAITDLIAAAEERGRRAGIEERDDYARALYDLFMSIPPPQNPRWQAAFTQALPLIGRIKRESLAPRDSGKET